MHHCKDNLPSASLIVIVLILPCSVQNIEHILQQRSKLWVNEVSRDLSLDGYLILQQPHSYHNKVHVNISFADTSRKFQGKIIVQRLQCNYTVYDDVTVSVVMGSFPISLRSVWYGLQRFMEKDI